MAKPGDVVEFRAGLHGIQEPQNLGIYITRQRRKGVPWVQVATVEGRLDIKAEHLTKRAFRDRYEGDLRDDKEVTSRLRFLVSQNGKGGLAEEVEDDLGKIEEALWEAVADSDQEHWTDEELATALYGPSPSPLQRKQVREAVDRCRRRGVGRFETALGRGDTWRPWTREERDAMRHAWNALGALRARLVQVEETEEGRAFQRIELDAADLTEEDEATLAWAEQAMVQMIERDEIGAVPEDEAIAGIGGYGAVQAFGMDLHRSLSFLASDWIRSSHTTRSSDYVHFLLEAGRWSADDAVASLMRRHVNQEEFFEHKPDQAAAEAAEELREPDADGMDAGREDLRHLECYTIDPPDAKDFDDAVGIEGLPDGATRLWIHIADVSHYVRQGSNLDRHAKMRATSVYLPGRVLPMLPARIADHLCSLRDDGDRYAMSIALTVAADGRVQDAAFHKSIIRVDENLAYADALERAGAGQEPFASLLALADAMRTHRRGLAIDTGEIRVSLEESGFQATEKFATPATKMIETFMVAANEAVAKHLADEGLSLLYRCHPLPDAGKAERYAHQLESMGLEVPFDLPKKEGESTGSQSLLDQLKAGGGSINLFGGGLSVQGASDQDAESPPEEPDTPQGFAALTTEEQDQWLAPFRAATDAIAGMGDRARADVATIKMLACMGRAYYTPENEGHFGLASSHYCHFTSPIRRYPDLVVHRNLKWLIDGREGDVPHPSEELDTLCDHCSNQERAAAELERRIKGACLVLASLHGEDAFALAAARITGITPAGIFVSVGQGIDARISARDLPGGPYQVDEWESMLFLSDREAPQRFSPEDLKQLAQHYDDEYGEMRRVRSILGDAVQVRLAGRNVADGKTGAELVGWRA